tara:strand:+ start:4310 stop:4744 length:435 start_codon:yes stop_codon:yes gene_type:complete
MDILEQIFDQGYAVKTLKLGKGKVKADVRNLSTSNQLDIEQDLSKVKDSSSAYVLHKYSIGILSHTLLKYNGKTFKNPKETEKFLLELPTAVCDALITGQNQFEKEVANTITPAKVQDTFFEQGSTQEKSEQSPEVLSSENQEA